MKPGRKSRSLFALAVCLVGITGVALIASHFQPKPDSNRDAESAGINQIQAADSSWQWKMPISFFGLVLDEKNYPVPDATASLGWTTLTNEGHATQTVQSDSNGRFELRGASGKSLGVRVTKDGYYPFPNNPVGFEYAVQSERDFHYPDPLNPVVFRLRRKGQGVELLTSRYGVRPSLNIVPGIEGKPTWVDFFNRTVGDTGQLQIQKWGEAPDRETGRASWRLRLSIPDGGIIEHNDEFPFLARDGGYRQQIEWSFDRQSTNWQGSFEKTFYVRTGSPAKYGSLKVRSGSKMGVQLQYAINPEGGRNLEPK